MTGLTDLTSKRTWVKPGRLGQDRRYCWLLLPYCCKGLRYTQASRHRVPYEKKSYRNKKQQKDSEACRHLFKA